MFMAIAVVQGYAWEITTPEGGWGLHDVLKSRQDKLNGIVNGIDMSEWDPANDPDTAAAYSASDLSGMASCIPQTVTPMDLTCSNVDLLQLFCLCEPSSSSC